MTFEDLLKGVVSILWGPGMIVLLVGTGIFLSLRLGFLQIFHIGHAIRCVSGKYDRKEDSGDITHFQALAAALSATIGTGNIAGVATAITFGGPGAVFWMWVTALVGMATKFTSCSLSQHFREVHPDGSASGGPMYYLEKGFRPRWLLRLAGEERTRRWATLLGMSFAVFALIASFGIGNMVQAHSVVDGLQSLIPEQLAVSHQFNGTTINLTSFSIGLILALLVGVVIIGGIRRIAHVAEKIVPAMSILYILAAVIVLIIQRDQIPTAFTSIFKYAFTPFAAGGGVIGAGIAQTIRFGVARGVFSNESGLGSAPMAHAAAKTTEPIREGFVAMLGPFIDTIIICTMTALVILTAGVWQVRSSQGEIVYGIGAPNTSATIDGKLVVTSPGTPEDPLPQPLLDENQQPYLIPTSASLTADSFQKALPWGRVIVAFGLVFFAYSTIISWSYYGDRCAEYLFGPSAIRPYRYIYVALVLVGAMGGLKTIWSLADAFNALMAIPNLIGLIALSGFVTQKTRDYLRRLKAGEF
jgi:AGCS family alanine or glycine:cation symporter